VAVGLAAHYLLLPLVGFAFGWLFRDTFGYAVGFVLLAACPSASASNILVFLARGSVALAVTLAAVFSVAAFFSVPFLIQLALLAFGGEAQAVRLPVARTVLQLALLVLLPLAVGSLVRRRAPGFASRAEAWVGRLSLGFLLLLVAAITIENAALVLDSVARLGAATLAMGAISMSGGLLLARVARLPAKDALAIGMEAGVQNCTLAMLVALTILRSPEMALPAATYGLTMFIPALALAWLGRRGTREAAGA
jgi:BASS family bile acid:Na+ symporter